LNPSLLRLIFSSNEFSLFHFHPHKDSLANLLE
jgi:hypothetical protein